MATNDEWRHAKAATSIQIEMERFGRPASRQRALEIATELERYEAAIDRVISLSIVDCDPGVFMQTLIDLEKGPCK